MDFRDQKENSRLTDRQRVIEAAKKWVRTGLHVQEKGEVLRLAADFGNKYGILHLTENWILASRECFWTQEEANRWADSFPN